MTPTAEPIRSEGVPQPSRHPLAELLSLALPTIAQMTSYTVMQFTDTFMLSRVSDTAATAAAQAGMAEFSLLSFGVGTLLLVNALVSQSYGRGDFRACGRYLWQGVWVALFFGLLTLPLLPLAGPMFRAVGHPAPMAQMEASFFSILLGLATLKLVSVSVGQFLLAVNRPNVVLVAAASAAVVNALLNWVFIYGHLGLPAMGVSGSAWSTNGALLVELLILVAVASRPAMVGKFHVNDWRPRRAMLRTLLAVGAPSGVQIVAEVLAWTLFTVWIVARFGEAAMAANNYTFRFMSVSFMPIFGVSTAVTALVGRYLGMKKPDLAAARAHLGFFVAASYTFLCGLLFFFGRRTLVGLFTKDPQVLRVGEMLLTFAAAYQVFDAMYIIYNGALRGAGDTFVPAVVTGTLCWGFTVVGASFVAREFPALGVVGPWSTALAYGAILGVYLLSRFRRGQWKQIRLDQVSQEVSLPSNAVPVSDTVPGLN